MASPGAAQAVGSLSQTISDTLKSSTSSLTAAMSSATGEAVAADTSYGWLGLFGRILLALINFISTVLYWTLRITTINVPSILFTLFSTSWTVTMNATTL